jgi:hypothetical protein
LNKKNIIFSLAVICSVLILGAVIYNAVSVQNVTPNPTSTPSPQPSESPSPSPMPIESYPPDSKSSIVVPDDYPTISAAIYHAAQGATIYVKKGTYEVPINQTLVINKTLSLIGEDARNTIISLHPAYNVTWILTTPFFSYSDAITIDANDVKLLNLTIIIANPGGYISATGDRTQIIGNTITTGPTSYLFVRGSLCKITENIVGGRIQLNGSFNEIAQNSFDAIYLEHGDSNTISNNTCGFLGLGYTNQTCSYNVISGNKIETETRSYSGILVGSSTDNVFHDNYIAGFSFGIELIIGPSENNTFYHNTFIDNFRSFYIYNAGSYVIANFWDNGKEGNYWSDYNGTDTNGDGMGDTPYIINESNQDRYPLMEPFAIPEFP